MPLNQCCSLDTTCKAQTQVTCVMLNFLTKPIERYKTKWNPTQQEKEGATDNRTQKNLKVMAPILKDHILYDSAYMTCFK
jgi:hypothetical protein